MQTYDIIMLAVLGITTFMGAIKGLAWQIASLASIIVSYFAAYQLRDRVATLIQAQEPWNGFLAMLLIYAVSSFGIWLVFRLMSSVIDSMRMRDFDRHMGAVIGFGKGALLCIIITLFAVTLLGPKQQQAIVNSRSGAYISKFLAATDGIVWPKEVETIIRPYLDRAEQRLDQRGGGGNLANDGFLPRSSDGSSGLGQGGGSWFGGTSPSGHGSAGSSGNILPENLGNGSWQIPFPGNPVSTPNQNGANGWPSPDALNDLLPAIR
jgi:membrane protein required for colicin V production